MNKTFKLGIAETQRSSKSDPLTASTSPHYLRHLLCNGWARASLRPPPHLPTPAAPSARLALPIAPVLYPAPRRTSARVVSFRGRPPTDVMAKLRVTPLRAPRRPVSSEARDGEQVDAAEWKSMNLENERSLRSQAPALPRPSLLPCTCPLLPQGRGSGAGDEAHRSRGDGRDLHPEALGSGCPPHAPKTTSAIPLSPAGPHGRETPFESQNHQGWKRPLRSSSPTINPSHHAC